MGHGTSTHSATKHGEETPLQHSMPTMPANRSATDAPREPIPTVSASDRAAAFPAVQPHAMHGTSSHRYLSVDRLELRDGDEGNVAAWEATGWVGGDTDRFWLRTEGEHADGRIESGNVEVFKGRAIARWWDAVAGIRHDFGEGPSQTFAAIGVMGLAPYKFEFEATAYLGTSGQTAINLETEYETLFTNRLILQSVVEINAYGKDDARRGIGSGLSSIEAGLRLRYEFTRQFAPYVGIMRERKFGRTADFAEADGAPSDDTLLLAGVRLWF